MQTAITAHPITTPQRRTRWWLRGLVAIALLFALLAGVGYLFLFVSRVSLADAEAQATLSDPDWRLEDLEAKRRVVADADNSALHVIAVMRKGGGVSVRGVPNYDAIFDKLPPTAQLNVDQDRLIRGQLNKIAKPLVEARQLKDMPYGRFKVKYSPDFISTLLRDHQSTREIADWLMHDSYLLAQEDQPDQAIESCCALFNAGRTMGDEPFLISHLIRCAIQAMGVRAVERVLGQGEANDESLEKLQALLLKESAESTWTHGLRGERAGMHMLFTNIQAGQINMPVLRGLVGMKRSSSIRDWLHDYFPSTMLKYYPEHLRHMTEIVELSKRPLHEQRKRIGEFDSANGGKMPDNPITALFGSANMKVYEADCRCQADLRATYVALACERYRLKHERWPGSLEELVTAKLLDAIPLDPYDGQPLRYRRTKEGFVVYAIGPDNLDNDGHIDGTQAPTPGFDLGFRLWDRDLRRQAPLPPVVLPEGQAP